jgi:hypothetical protein
MKKSLNEIAKFEKAIKEKYGASAILNPKGLWDEAKENKYLKELKKFYKSTKDPGKTTKIKNGYKIRERKKNKAEARTCPVCSVYSLSRQDDLYMNKYKCCFECYIQYVEAREDRWNSGWRPNN